MSDSGFDYLGGNYYISAASLLLEYRSFIDTHPTLFKVNVANPYWPKLVYFCEELEKFPRVMKAITKIHINSQMDFERALFCSWCALLVARTLNLPENNQRLLFLAGLLQDIGKHATEEVPNKSPREINGPISSVINTTNIKSTQLLDNHPVVSARLVEKFLPELDGLSELVLHHHARNDGTGFPNHVGENQLDIDCQVLIIANEISDRLDSLGGHNQIYQTLANLKLNSMLYFDKAHLNWLALLEPNVAKRVKLQENGLYDEVVAKVDSLEKMLSCLLVLSAELLPHDYDLGIHGLRSMIHRLTCLSADTGIFDPVLFKRRARESVSLVEYDEADLNKCAVVRDVALILTALPEILHRMLVLVDDIIERKKYDLNYSLVQSARDHLHRNEKLLEGRRCSIFR